MKRPRTRKLKKKIEVVVNFILQSPALYVNRETVEHIRYLRTKGLPNGIIVQT